MSKEKKEIYLLPENIINENNKIIKSKIKEIDNLEKNRQYYLAIYTLESLIIQDGTNAKLNFKFLNLILDHYDEIIKDLKNYSSGILLDEDFQLKYEDAINDSKNIILIISEIVLINTK